MSHFKTIQYYMRSILQHKILQSFTLSSHIAPKCQKDLRIKNNKKSIIVPVWWDFFSDQIQKWGNKKSISIELTLKSALWPQICCLQTIENFKWHPSLGKFQHIFTEKKLKAAKKCLKTMIFVLPKKFAYCSYDSH